MTDQSQARTIWASVDAVCFDVDSTVCVDEAIDRLAAHCGVEAQVAEWTRRAMGGSVSFQEALTERLNIIQPTKSQLYECLRQYPPQLTPGIQSLVSKLQSKGIHVYLVSGGFRVLIDPVAELLAIPLAHIYANDLFFNDAGQYIGFDAVQPTSRSGGKAEVIRLLKSRFSFNRVCVVGDGVTDLEARPPADLFIGFGGNVIRAKVQANADWFVTDFHDLEQALDA